MSGQRARKRAEGSLVGGRGSGGAWSVWGYIHGDSARCAVTAPGRSTSRCFHQDIYRASDTLLAPCRNYVLPRIRRLSSATGFLDDPSIFLH